MFPREATQSKRVLLFVAGFHLGIPLAICQTRKSKNWAEIRKELSGAFSRYPASFEVVSVDYEPETNFPLGNPLTIRYVNFFDVFDLSGYLRDEGFSLRADKDRLLHVIWVCPSGVVLITGGISFDADDAISLTEFEENVIESHYAELSCVFAEVAEITYSTIPAGALSSSLCSSRDMERIRDCIRLRQQSSGTNLHDEASGESGGVRFPGDSDKERALYEDVLMDVYYIDFRADADEEKLRIGYVDSSIACSDPSTILMIGIAYSSFVGLLWLVKHLGEESRILQDNLIGNLGLRKGVSSELKLFRIFCLQFITESKPVSVRLTRAYMECVEQFWVNSRLDSLVEQVNDQLGVLERVFDWVEESRREVRNIKIALAAVLLALISITSVAAQLISTVDVNFELGAKERVLLISSGFIIGVLSTTVIYVLPISVGRVRSH